MHTPITTAFNKATLVVFWAFCITLSTAALNAVANDVYKTIDEKGKVTFSDNPTGKKIESVDLPPINTTPAVDPQPYQPKEPTAKPRYSIYITSPSHETEILPGQRDITVTARIIPRLQNGFSAQLYMNGKPFGAAQPYASFVVSEITRGEHSLTVAVLNPNGKVVSRSRPVTVYVFRPNVFGR